MQLLKAQSLKSLDSVGKASDEVCKSLNFALVQHVWDDNHRNDLMSVCVLGSKSNLLSSLSNTTINIDRDSLPDVFDFLM